MRKNKNKVVEKKKEGKKERKGNKQAGNEVSKNLFSSYRNDSCLAFGIQQQ